MSEFLNFSPLDFSLDEVQANFEKAIASVRKRSLSGALSARPLIGGKLMTTSEKLYSINPSRTSENLGEVFLGTVTHVEEAVRILTQGQSDWSAFGFEKRAEILRKTASLMKTRRFELSALIVLEAGKPWGEADADVCEAIDFCEYYADIAVELHAPRHLQPYLLGETNHYSYAPRGLSVVISPWNFPLAIACGMTVASLVAGNPTILKPAEQTSLIAQEFANILLEAGVPDYAFAFIPGIGETIGRALVQNRATHLICFTGSRSVGLEILRSCSEFAKGQTHIKRSILELGGKNAIIVDADADFDEAIKGVLYSAFGFAGQKCSACSRLIIVGQGYEPFLERLCEATADLIIGEAENPATYVGPLIDEESCSRVEAIREASARSLREVFRSDIPSGGFFSPVSIFRDVPHDHSLWQEEVFAPVLACAQAKDFESAIQIANNCQYALTGGAFSRSPKHLAMARNELLAGNVYLNRGITGAIVGRQPFGGFKLSGIGSKAGGPDYLLQFMEPRTVTENTMRKGFTPELSE